MGVYGRMPAMLNVGILKNFKNSLHVGQAVKTVYRKRVDADGCKEVEAGGEIKALYPHLASIEIKEKRYKADKRTEPITVTKSYVDLLMEAKGGGKP